MNAHELAYDSETIREQLIQQIENKYLSAARTALEIHNQRLDQFKEALQRNLEITLQQFKEELTQNLKDDIKNIIDSYKDELLNVL